MCAGILGFRFGLFPDDEKSQNLSNFELSEAKRVFEIADFAIFLSRWKYQNKANAKHIVQRV